MAGSHQEMVKTAERSKLLLLLKTKSLLPLETRSQKKMMGTHHRFPDCRDPMTVTHRRSKFL